MPATLGLEANDLNGVQERRESILNLPTITKDEILYYDHNWERLVSRHKTWKVQAARKIRIAYGNLFYENQRLPMLRTFLERNKFAYKVRKTVAKVIGY